MKRLIVTADDFGLAQPVNEAVAEAHRNGVLTTASLMVSAAEAADAVGRARALPTLRVGLHLVLVEGRPVLPPAAVPALVGPDGRFSIRLVRAGFSFFFGPDARRQLEREIRAQLEAFARTGLELDHVNAHNHMHLHPTVLSILLRVGAEFGMRAVRLPLEPVCRSIHGLGAAPRLNRVFLAPWVARMRRLLAAAGMRCNDRLFGLVHSGAMVRDRVLAIIAALPEGATELYFHPATRRCPELEETMRGYRHQEELVALTDPAVRAGLDRRGIQRISFCDLP